MSTKPVYWLALMPYWGGCTVASLVADTLRPLAAQSLPAHNEQIGERAGHQQAMRVLLQPAIAHLGEAEPPLDDPDRMLRRTRRRKRRNSLPMRRFVDIDLGHEPVLEETTVCRFRHLLEAHDLGQRLFDHVQRHLTAKGLKVVAGTIVDAVLAKAGIINAPSSTKNADNARDPELDLDEEEQPMVSRDEAHVEMTAAAS